MGTLSLCMIARDEAELLPRCLASVRGVVDEIVLVDTGSTDATVAIAQAAGARLGHFAWSDDFAAARNASLELARGDWILVLDPDEILLPGAAEALRSAMEGPHAGYLLPLENETDQDEREGHVALLRLFRRDSAIRFQGRVHEQVRESLEACGLSIGSCAARIRHDGYRSVRVEARGKLSRNLALLQRRAVEEPDSIYVRFHLGKTYLALKQPAEAIAPLREALELMRADPDPARYPYRERCFLLLATARWRAEGIEAAREEILAGLDRMPLAAELWQFRGMLEQRRGEAGAAELAYRHALKAVAGRREFDEVAGQAALGLGKILEARGEFLAACEQYRFATRCHDRLKDAWVRLGATCLQLGDPAGAIAAYETVRALDPCDYAATLALATLAFERGDFRGSLQALELAEALRPGSPEIALFTGECRRLLGLPPR